MLINFQIVGVRECSKKLGTKWVENLQAAMKMVSNSAVESCCFNYICYRLHTNIFSFFRKTYLSN